MPEHFLDNLENKPFTFSVSVSMGGTIGFFLGASLLSIAELFYYFFIRKTNLSDKKKKPKLKVKAIAKDKIKQKTNQPKLMGKRGKLQREQNIPYLP